MCNIGIDAEVVQYINGSVLYKEDDVVKLRSLIFSNDPTVDTTIIPCRIASVNHHITGISTPTGLPAFKYGNEYLVQGSVKDFTIRELAKLIYSLSYACDIELDDEDTTSLLFSQHICAGSRNHTIKCNQHSSISEYPIDKGASLPKIESKYRELKSHLRGRGIVQCPISIIPTVNTHELFQFLKQ